MHMTLYWSIHGSVLLLAQATLSRDVFAESDELRVQITIHEAGAVKRPAVTRVKAKIVQYMSVYKNNRSLLRPPLQITLDKVKEVCERRRITCTPDDKLLLPR